MTARPLPSLNIFAPPPMQPGRVALSMARTMTDGMRAPRRKRPGRALYRCLACLVLLPPLVALSLVAAWWILRRGL